MTGDLKTIRGQKSTSGEIAIGLLQARFGGVSCGQPLLRVADYTYK